MAGLGATRVGNGLTHSGNFFAFCLDTILGLARRPWR